MNITFHDKFEEIDFEALRLALIADDFHNGRTTEQLRDSFMNSRMRVFAICDEACVGVARALSDGVGNAYVLDVWTLTSHRHRDIGRRMMQIMLDAGPGQHFYLQSDDDTVEFYQKLGFEAQPSGMSIISGNYLNPNP